MSFISTLTWSCIELQSVIENADISEDEKSDAILKHLKSTDDCDREPFPEFESGIIVTLRFNVDSKVICHSN